MRGKARLALLNPCILAAGCGSDPAGRGLDRRASRAQGACISRGHPGGAIADRGADPVPPHTYRRLARTPPTLVEEPPIEGASRVKSSRDLDRRQTRPRAVSRSGTGGSGRWLRLRISARAFSPDGKTLAADQLGLGATLWEVPGGAERTTLLFPQRQTDAHSAG